MQPVLTTEPVRHLTPKARKSILNYIPKELRIKLNKVNKQIEDYLGRRVSPLKYKPDVYLARLKSLNVPEHYYRLQESVLVQIIPARNDVIKNTCRNNILPTQQGITPCGLKTNLKFPCYLCRWEYSSFGAKLKKLSEEEWMTQMKSLITFNKELNVIPV